MRKALLETALFCVAFMVSVVLCRSHSGITRLDRHQTRTLARNELHKRDDLDDLLQTQAYKDYWQNVLTDIQTTWTNTRIPQDLQSAEDQYYRSAEKVLIDNELPYKYLQAASEKQIPSDASSGAMQDAVNAAWDRKFSSPQDISDKTQLSKDKALAATAKNSQKLSPYKSRLAALQNERGWWDYLCSKIKNLFSKASTQSGDGQLSQDAINDFQNDVAAKLDKAIANIQKELDGEVTGVVEEADAPSVDSLLGDLTKNLKAQFAQQKPVDLVSAQRAAWAQVISDLENAFENDIELPTDTVWDYPSLAYDYITGGDFAQMYADASGVPPAENNDDQKDDQKDSASSQDDPFKDPDWNDPQAVQNLLNDLKAKLASQWQDEDQRPTSLPDAANKAKALLDGLKAASEAASGSKWPSDKTQGLYDDLKESIVPDVYDALPGEAPSGSGINPSQNPDDLWDEAGADQQQQTDDRNDLNKDPASNVDTTKTNLNDNSGKTGSGKPSNTDENTDEVKDGTMFIPERRL